jgi:hypothetical protein
VWWDHSAGHPAGCTIKQGSCPLPADANQRILTLPGSHFVRAGPHRSQTRKVLIGGVTDGAANAAWCAQVARNLSEARDNRVNRIKYLVHGRDKSLRRPR